MQTYNSRCKPCLSGSIHPTHDDGTEVDVGTDPDYSQLPQEAGDIEAAFADVRAGRAKPYREVFAEINAEASG